MPNKSNDQTKFDFYDFISNDSEPLPEALSSKALNNLQKKINPSFTLVLFKILAIHIVFGFLTLLFCPQFGFSLTSQLGLVSYLMYFGHEVCTLLCGSIFMSLSFLFACFYLKTEEVRLLKNNILVKSLFLTLISLFGFWLAGAEVMMSLTFIWASGAIIGSALTLDLSWALRKKIILRAF